MPLPSKVWPDGNEMAEASELDKLVNVTREQFWNVTSSDVRMINEINRVNRFNRSPKDFLVFSLIGAEVI